MPALAPAYTVQPSLIGSDDPALVCPNCGAYNERPYEWLEARAGDEFPCGMCGIGARIPALPRSTIGD